MAVDDGVQFVRGAVTKTAVAVSPASVVVVAWRASNILAVTSLLPGIVRSIVETLGEVAMLIGRTVSVWKACAGWRRRRISGGRIRRRRRGRNGGGFVVLRCQSSIVQFVVGGVCLGRAFDVHERHRARHLARFLFTAAPRQQLNTLYASIPFEMFTYAILSNIIG